MFFRIYKTCYFLMILEIVFKEVEEISVDEFMAGRGDILPLLNAAHPSLRTNLYPFSKFEWLPPLFLCLFFFHSSSWSSCCNFTRSKPILFTHLFGNGSNCCSLNLSGSKIIDLRGVFVF
jgi:hypothetical protein